MATIIREYGLGTDKRARYNLVHDSGANLSDMVGQRLEIKAYILLEAPNADGEVIRSLKILTTDGEIAGTRSKSFIQGFEEFCDMLETDEVTEFEVGQKTSKQGRKYIFFIA